MTIRVSPPSPPTKKPFRLIPRAYEELAWATKGAVAGIVLGAIVVALTTAAIGRYDTRLVFERGRRTGFEQGSKECHTPTGVVEHGAWVKQ